MKIALTSCAALLAFAPSLATAQMLAVPPPRVDSANVVPGREYAAGGLHTFLLGSNYRDLWTTSLRVQLLDLQSFAGGLRPDKEGGGLQTKSLRFSSEDGPEYVFRTVDKAPHLRPPLEGAAAEAFFRDQTSSVHPAAALVAAPLLEAAHVMHSSPTLVVMPDDSLLGKFREAYAGKLGIIEVYQGKPVKGVGFEGAVDLIDSDSLLKLLAASPTEQVDARAMLRARLMDFLLNDVDRHPGQWKWARMEKGRTAPWIPVPRDRDQAFVAFHGVLPSLARMAAPNLVKFDALLSVAGLTYNSLEMDRRLLGGLEKPAWDSVAAELVRLISNSVITGAVAALPAEYRLTEPRLESTLRLRRDNLPDVANQFYFVIAAVADIHATDAAEQLTVTRTGDRFVDVRIRPANGTGEAAYFHRRFDARETREIRVYLHGGDDTAVVVGDMRTSIRVRIIGGGGTNLLVDSSKVGGHAGQAHLYDGGKGKDRSVGPDTLFNRRPWVSKQGKLEPPGRDRGSSLMPVAWMSFPRDLGVVPQLGVRKTNYGFNRTPYSSELEVDAEYSTATGGFRFTTKVDRRFEDSPFHVTAVARVSQLEVIHFHGLGNDTPDSNGAYFDVRQQQWMVHPAIAFSLGEWSDVSLGPVVQYASTANSANRMVSAPKTYGAGNFTQAGMQLALHHVASGAPESRRKHFVLDVVGAYYPAMLDVKSAFTELSARAAAVFTLPLPLHPIVLVRGGGQKLWGAFPFSESAFLGGSGTLPSMELERYAGDASLYATSELRVPLVKFSFFLPLEVGLVGIAETGRVYVGSTSPGGWHSAHGGGIFFGRRDATATFMIAMTNEPGHTGLRFRTGLSF